MTAGVRVTVTGSKSRPRSVTRRCVACGGAMPERARRDARYCSSACRQRAYRARVTDRRPVTDPFTVADFMRVFPGTTIVDERYGSVVGARSQRGVAVGSRQEVTGWLRSEGA
jgi:hypothetical protein